MTYPKVGPDASSDVPPGVPSSPRFPEIEERVERYWAADGTFRASVEQRPAGENGSNEFVFYDGPPFANGLPHYGHLLTGYVKDVVPRYQTMRGRRVERRFGWDTHGLPAELEAERQLGIKGRGDILKLGIETFNAACRESVLKYTREWEDYVTRQARWVDFENDYKTLELPYMESVIWAFKTLYDKGYVYEGQRVLPYCWVDETPLSNHELRMDDDVYQQRQDPSVTVWVELETGERLMAWTTTPWTLPTNEAMAVGRRPRLRRGRARGGAVRPRRRPARRLHARARRRRRRPGGGPAQGLRARRTPVHTAVRLPHRHREVRHAERLPRDRAPSTSPRTTAPASSTCRRRTARTTRSPARQRVSRRSSPSTTARGSPRSCRRSRDCRCSRPTARSPRTSRRAGTWCARRATSTPTRTAGGAGTR